MQSFFFALFVSEFSTDRIIEKQIEAWKFRRRVHHYGHISINWIMRVNGIRDWSFDAKKIEARRYRGKSKHPRFLCCLHIDHFIRNSLGERNFRSLHWTVNRLTQIGAQASLCSDMSIQRA